MATERPDPQDVPIVKGRLISSVLLFVAFLVSMVLAPKARSAFIPMYLFISGAVLIGINWIESRRMDAYIELHYPKERTELCPKNGFRYDSLRSLKFAFKAVDDEEPALARIRRRARQAWLHTLITPIYLFLAINVAVELSK